MNDNQPIGAGDTDHQNKDPLTTPVQPTQPVDGSSAPERDSRLRCRTTASSSRMFGHKPSTTAAWIGALAAVAVTVVLATALLTTRPNEAQPNLAR